ncbi:MAG: glycoside hydrolase family 2 TIM barrel-domain containing protein [Lachnospiraceae bacterium]
MGLSQDINKVNVNLPYDAQLSSKRNPDAIGTYMTGYYDHGNWEYKKTFFIDKCDCEKKIIFQFDGVYERSQVYINGNYAGGKTNGYQQFFVDASTYLIPDTENEIKVIVHLANGARWYSGAGIYRDVYMLTAPLIYISPNSVQITTKDTDCRESTVEINARIQNESGIPSKKLRVRTTITTSSGEMIATVNTPFTSIRNEVGSYHQTLSINEPKLWSAESPTLYQYSIELIDSENIIEYENGHFGIRSIQVSPKAGFCVNNQTVKLRGACVHHDNGSAGSVSTDFIELRRIRKLKEAGFNAIRTAHNPASPALLRACDQLGMYVMEEAFDVWNQTKMPLDYSLDFQNHWEDELESMIQKSFNHPSVIMYSVGNEIPETGSDHGAVLERKIVQKARQLDPTRPIINCINGMVSVMPIMEKMFQNSQEAMQQQNNSDEESSGGINSMMGNLGDTMKQVMLLPVVGDATEESYSYVDIAGYNYMDSRYLMDITTYPNRIICGTETFPSDIDRNWNLVMNSPQIIGDFTWTGWDYIGEAGIGLVHYEQFPFMFGVNAPYPCLTAMSGDISITGFRRPVSYYREIVFGGRKDPYIAVKKIFDNGKPPISTPWSWNDSISSWSWNGYEGKLLSVEVYSDSDEIELVLNGESLGRKKITQNDRFKIEYDISYVPGTLSAISYTEGIVTGSYSLSSADSDLGIHVSSEYDSVSPEEHIYLNIYISDSNGIINHNCTDIVEIEVTGPCQFISHSTDDPMSFEDPCNTKRSLFDGKSQIVLKPEEPGVINLTIKSSKFGTATKQVLVR